MASHTAVRSAKGCVEVGRRVGDIGKLRAEGCVAAGRVIHLCEYVRVSVQGVRPPFNS